jgi:hypothetical protein
MQGHLPLFPPKATALCRFAPPISWSSMPICLWLSQKPTQTRRNQRFDAAGKRAYLDHFWRRFASEYLTNLRDKAGWNHPKRRLSIGRTPRIGEPVLVEVDFTARNLWPMAIVDDLEIRAGAVRNAVLRFPDGALKTRPLNRLYPLEIQEEEPLNQWNHQNCRWQKLASVGTPSIQIWRPRWKKTTLWPTFYHFWRISQRRNGSGNCQNNYSSPNETPWPTTKGCGHEAFFETFKAGFTPIPWPTKGHGHETFSKTFGK